MSYSVKNQFERKQICLGNVHKGDHLEFPGIDGQHKRHVICTYASVDGDRIEITEYTKSDPFSFEPGKVLTQIVSYWELKKEKVVKLIFSAALRLSNKETAERAKSRVGENRYNIVFNNCEHFAFWCKYGPSVGLQVYYQFKKETENMADFKHQFEAEQINWNVHVHEGDHLEFPGINGQEKHYAVCIKVLVDSDEIVIIGCTKSYPCSSELSKVRTRIISYRELKEEKVVKLICLTELPLSNEETIKRAKSRVGESCHNSQCNNCEHFAFWCKYGCSIGLQLYDKFKKEIFKHQFDREIYWNVREGDHFIFPGIDGLYEHQAVCTDASVDGNKIEITEYTSDPFSFELGKVLTRTVSYRELEKKKVVKLKCLTKEPLNNKETVKRAKSRVGENCENILLNINCEHFVWWCKYGPSVSLQLYNQFKKEAVNIADFKHQFKKEEISNNVREGDHLEFPGRWHLPYTHHALCIDAPVDGDKIEIIEYAIHPRSFGKGLLLCDSERAGKVRTKTFTYQELKEKKVVKLKCLTKESLSNKETVERAKSRLGENCYSGLVNNCEHFVWWCKYGISVSQQLQDDCKRRIAKTGKHLLDVGKAACKKLAVEGSHLLTNPYLVKVAANVSDEVAGFLFANATPVGFAIGGVIEVVWAANEIYKANKKRKKKVITTKQFVKQTATVCVKTTCRFSGGVVGSVIGSAFGPVGSLAGGAIGAVVGHFVGSFFSGLFG